LGGRYAHPIRYFDNRSASDGLQIGGASHEQGGSHDPSGLCKVKYRRGGCRLQILNTSGVGRSGISFGIGVTRILD